MSYTKLLSEIKNDTFLTEETKNDLIKYTSYHYVKYIDGYCVRYIDLLKAVWSLARNHDGIRMSLNQEIKDAEYTCTNGVYSHLINCLSGYDDRVNIGISEEDQIINVITNVMKKESNPKRQRELASDELIERGFKRTKIREWIKYIE
jgi:hypothetical protein